MPYIGRNEAGEIVAIARHPNSGGAGTEQLPYDAPEVQAFLAAQIEILRRPDAGQG